MIMVIIIIIIIIKSNKSTYQKGRKKNRIADTRKNKAEKISLRHIHKHIDLKT